MVNECKKTQHLREDLLKFTKNLKLKKILKNKMEKKEIYQFVKLDYYIFN